MRLSKSVLGLAALALLAGPAMVSTPALAGANDYSTSGTDTPPRQYQDWEVFGFDLSSIPDDPASLAAFKASLDPLTQLAIHNRCRDSIAINPFYYSPKVHEFCQVR